MNASDKGLMCKIFSNMMDNVMFTDTLGTNGHLNFMGRKNCLDFTLTQTGRVEHSPGSNGHYLVHNSMTKRD